MAVLVNALTVTVSLNLIVTVAGCLLKTGSANGSVTHTMFIPYNKAKIPAQTFDFNIPVPPGALP